MRLKAIPEIPMVLPFSVCTAFSILFTKKGALLLVHFLDHAQKLKIISDTSRIK